MLIYFLRPALRYVLSYKALHVWYPWVMLRSRGIIAQHYLTASATCNRVYCTTFPDVLCVFSTYGSFHPLSGAQFASPDRQLANAAEMDRISSHGLFLHIGDMAMWRRQKKSMVCAGLCVDDCHAKVIFSFDFGIIKNYSAAQIFMVESARSRRPDQCCTV